MRRFKPITRDMDYLFPPSMNDWLPEEHLARFIVEIVDQLDLSQMERACSDRGSDAFHPATYSPSCCMATLRACFRPVNWSTPLMTRFPYRFVAADPHPDHDTLNTFRKRFLERDQGADGTGADDRPHARFAPPGEHCGGCAG